MGYIGVTEDTGQPNQTLKVNYRNSLLPLNLQILIQLNS